MAPNHPSAVAIQAAVDGNLGLLKKMASKIDLREAKDPSSGWNLLHFAAVRGHLEVCRFLVEESALDVNSTTADGTTPVNHAAAAGEVIVLRYLLDRGGDPAMPDVMGTTPLHVAADSGHCEAITLLLTRGVDVNAPNVRLVTPLDVVAGKGHDQAVKVLLEHGADGYTDGHLPRMAMAAGGDVRDWSELPVDALSLIFANLGPLDILMGAGFVCHSWLDAAREPSLWHHLDMSSHNNVVKDKCRSGDTDVLCAMAKKAIDHSGGQLEVFIGEEFVDDHLLKYIGERAPSLKVLRLISCFHVLNEGFVEAISKFPLLEELNLSTCKSIGGRATYAAVGKACENLKQFILVKEFTEYGKFGDDEAYGIATMHGIRSLKITCGEMNNKAMATILDKCPHLESLDLTRCYNVVMDGAMRAKCAGIKMSVDHSYPYFFPDGRLIL